MNVRDAYADASFTEFAVTARAQLRNTAYLLCADWDRAADHVQEGLIRVYVAWPRLTRRGGELAYARRAVVSAYIDASRKRSSREQPTTMDVSRPSPEDVASTVADRDALMRALSLLPPRQRACVVLRYFEELDVKGTAEVLGCSEGTVKSQTSRALAALRSTFVASSSEAMAGNGERTLSW